MDDAYDLVMEPIGRSFSARNTRWTALEITPPDPSMVCVRAYLTCALT